MDYLVSMTEKSVRDMEPIKILKYINFAWFSNFFKIYISSSKGDPKIYVDGKKLYVIGYNNIVKRMAKFVEGCGVTDEKILESLEYTPKYVNGEIVEIKTPPAKFLLNVSNSCGMDSLLSIMFFAKGGYFISQIVNSSFEKYPPWLDSESIKRESKRIKTVIVDLYNRTSWTRQNIKDLQKSISVYMEDDCNDVKSGNEIWGTFCTMFDGLSFPVLTKRQKEIGNKPTETFTIPIGDDTFPNDLVIKPNHLVYLNDTDTTEKNFAELGYGDLEGYDLVGIVNYLPGHYTSLIKVQDAWYSYNDLNGDIKPYRGNVLKQTPQKLVVMMFYVKI